MFSGWLCPSVRVEFVLAGSHLAVDAMQQGALTGSVVLQIASYQHCVQMNSHQYCCIVLQNKAGWQK